MTKHHGDVALDLVASHIVVSTYTGVQTIPDKQLPAVGAKRISAIRSPYFGVACNVFPVQNLRSLYAQLLKGIANYVRGSTPIRLREAMRSIAAGLNG